MAKFLLPFAAAIVVAAPATAQTNPDLAAVQRSLSGVQSMVASFSQTDRNGQVLTGTLTLKKPGKIRFQYQKGVPLLIVGDGKALTFIDYSVRQVQRWPIANSPLSVLYDTKRDIAEYARIVPSANPAVLSVEVYDPKHPEYGRITLVFARSAAAPAGLLLQGWAALDSQGNRTTIRLTDQRFNVPVEDLTFRWTDPRRQGRTG